MTHAQIETAFQAVLSRHPQIGPADLRRLRLTPTIITEAQDGDTPLSDAILDACFPRSNTTLEYVHYTPFDTLVNLVQSPEWRLYWVWKRITEAEFATFSADHGLDGYFDVDPLTGNQRYEDLCKDLFYTSLTKHPSANEAAMWQTFGDRGRGVRLVFRVRPILNRSQFRPVRYKNALSQTVIQELSEASRTHLGRRLVLMGISRIGAFYLPPTYQGEDEARLLVKRFQLPAGSVDPWACVRSDGTHQYLPIPLNQDKNFCRIDLVRVDAGPNCSQQRVYQELRKHPRLAHLARRGCLGIFFPWR